MTPTNVIGLTGKLGSGKDTVLERLQTLYGSHRYRKASFAAPLKVSAAALLDLNLEQIEAMKNEPTIRVSILDIKGYGRDLGRSFSMREFLQRYGTEAHRGVFGDDFWVQAAMGALAKQRELDEDLGAGPYVYVFTDVRFENEARAIREAGGLIYEVRGPDVDTGSHPSEAGIPDGLIEWTLDNSTRPSLEDMQGERYAEARSVCISDLDDEVAKLHAEIEELRA